MKKISKAQMNALCKATAPKPVTVTLDYGDKNVVLEINSAPSIEIIHEIVAKTVSSCFVEDEFHPDYYRLIMFAMMLQHLTNVELPADAEGNLDLETVSHWMMIDKLQDAIFGSDIGSYIYMLCGQALEWKKERILSRSKLDELVEQLHDIGDIMKDDEFQTMISALMDSQKQEVSHEA